MALPLHFDPKAALHKLCMQDLYAAKMARANSVSPHVDAASQSTRTEDEARAAIGRNPRGWQVAYA